MRRFIDEILASAICFFLLLLGGGALFWRAEESENRRECEDALRQLAQEKVDDLVRWRNERLTDARVLSADPYLTEAFVNFLQQRRDDDGKRILSFLGHLRGYGYADALLADARGNIVLSLAQTHDKIHAPARAAVRESLANKGAEVGWVDWHIDPQEKISPHLVAMAAIANPQDNAVAGFLFLVMEIEHLRRMLVARTELRKTLDIQLVRREGDDVVFISEGYHKADTALRHRVSLAKKDLPAVMAVEGRTGTVNGLDERGHAVLAAIAPVPNSPWFLVCQQDAAEALAFHRRSTGLIFIAFIALLTTFVAISGMFLQRRQKRLALARAEAAQIAQQAQAERLRIAEQARTILMSIGDAVIAVDKDGCVEMMNPVAEELTGWQAVEAGGVPMADVFRIINEETRQPVASPFARVLREGIVVGLANHTLLIRRDGREIPIADSGAPVRDQMGNIAGMVVVFRDQTQERAAARALRDSEERLRMLIERMRNGVAVYAAVDGGEDFIFVDINPAVERIEKVKRADAIGRRVTEVFPGVREFGLLEVFRRVWQTGQPEHFPLAFYRDERISGWRDNFVYRLPSGEVVAVYDDRTAEKEAEEMLKRERTLLSHITETVPVAIVMVDADGRISFANHRAEEIFGMSRADICKLRYDAPEFRIESWDGEPFPHEQLPFVRVMATGESVREVKHAISKPDGSRVELSINAAAMRGDDGRILGMVAAITDITIQRKLEERLRHAEKMDAIGQMASGVAHDFNNQLAAILGYGELLTYRLTDVQLRQYAENICAAAHCAADITRQLLAFSRKGRQVTLPVDMHKVLSDVVKLLEHTVDKRVEIRQHLHAMRYWVSGDPSQLQTALLNLALNARDAMPKGGILTFATAVEDLPADEATHTPAGKYLAISISDTGTGMTPEIMGHLFEPFFTTKEAGRGTGLGLAAVHGAVRNHGGRIQVQSEVGKGSVFTIYLPLLATAVGKAAAEGETPEVMAEKAARILVVDDEPLLRDLAVEILQSLGYKAITCKDGDEALGYYLQSWQHIDLVILDMIMPKRGGHETFVALRKINPRVKVILASGYSLAEEVKQTMDEGAVDFLQKPFRRDELARKVAAALAAEA